jgi:uncharacterized protein YbaR (Trm112 family)
MRLLTHNMLQCPRTKAYPLVLTATEVDDVEVDYRREFVLRMVPRLDWAVLRAAAAALNVAGLVDRLPLEPPGADASDEVLRPVHAALMEWHVVEGRLACEGGPVYAISGGIPNLIPSDNLSEQTSAAAAAAAQAARVNERGDADDDDDDDDDDVAAMVDDAAAGAS